jgi:large subunit ribosomal protein L15
MFKRKTKKVRMLRGYKRCHGSGKRNRGAGNRGGRGRSGQGKRAGHNKIEFITREGANFLGKHGFTSVKQKKNMHPNAINTDQLDKEINSLIVQKIAVKTPHGIELDLSKAGYQKLLGNGLVKNKLIVHVQKFSESAKQKIEAAGGKIVSEE